jgi:aminodeoxyfutalosine synthase
MQSRPKDKGPVVLNPGGEYSQPLQEIATVVLGGGRISVEDAVVLFRHSPLGWLGWLASEVRFRINGSITWYNRNYHIEPTNRCVYNCRFCSYNEHHNSRVWDYTPEEIAAMASSAPEGITEIHIVGGVAPGRGTDYYTGLLRAVRNARPGVSIKAYSAIEISYMSQVDGRPLEEVILRLQEAGLDAIPGGGAEIFDPAIRKRICPEKDDANRWLEVHRVAHRLGVPTNATILYGHIEDYVHRAEHLDRIRQLQDETGGFLAFIPLKYKHANNSMAAAGEVSATDDLRNYAVTRIFLDNVPHLKAYWPMIGRDIAQLSQSFGVDDLDGTIHDSTTIYSAAGAADQHPEMTAATLEQLIRDAGYDPAERDSLYRPLGSSLSDGDVKG